MDTAVCRDDRGKVVILPAGKTGLVCSSKVWVWDPSSPSLNGNGGFSPGVKRPELKVCANWEKLHYFSNDIF